MIQVTVSQLNRYLRAVLEEDPKLSDLYVQGEISNYTRHYQSGHLYFSLKDAGSSIRAVVYHKDAGDLRFEPENGMEVLARGHIGVYEKGGVYQLIVTDIQPKGAGAMAVAVSQIKRRLEGEGLFDSARKQPLPRYPGRVGVVTSSTGAAIQDIRRVLAHRYPLCGVVLAPARVQGEGAADSIRRALARLDSRGGCDVIIVGRGGGSAEDLWCFNDEGLARAVAACGTPVISAVGHETDYTICDFVADARASTPSVAAQMAVPDAEDLLNWLKGCRGELAQGSRDLILRRGLALRDCAAALRPAGALMTIKQEKLDFLFHLMYNNKRIFIHTLESRLRQRAAVLDTLSPLRVMERGYCAVFRENQPVTAVGQLSVKEELRLRFRDGWAGCAVREIDGEDPI